MSVFRTDTRRWAAFLPPIAWAMLIDATDFVSNIITGFISLFGIAFPIGAFLDTLFDGMQTLMALAVFKDPAFAITNLDFLIPIPFFDLFPSYTAKIIAHKLKLVR